MITEDDINIQIFKSGSFSFLNIFIKKKKVFSLELIDFNPNGFEYLKTMLKEFVIRIYNSGYEKGNIYRLNEIKKALNIK